MRNKNTIFIRPRAGLEICAFSGLVQDFPAHFHNYYLVGCLLADRRKAIVSGREYILEAGDVFVLNPLEAHACAGEMPFSWLAAHIAPMYMAELNQRHGGQKIPPRFPRAIWQNSPLASLFEGVFASLGTSGNADLRDLDDILAGLLAWAKNESLQKTQSVAGNDNFDQLCRHLQEHACEPASLDKMCALAGMGKYKLLRAFGKRFGISPWRYLEALRVNMGRQMLARGQELVDIAADCGFTDQSHFSRCFKARTGITPGRFRQAFQKAGQNCETR